MEGLPKNWLQRKCPIHVAMFADLLTPNSVQFDFTARDCLTSPKSSRKLNKFSWTLVKLIISIVNSLDGSSKRLISFTVFLY